MIWGGQADQSPHLGVVKALKKDLFVREAGPDHLHMFYELLDMIPAEQRVSKKGVITTQRFDRVRIMNNRHFDSKMV